MLNPNDPSSLAKAAYDCDFHQMHQLIEAGADINAVGTTGTALYAAVLNGDADVVNYLLSRSTVSLDHSRTSGLFHFKN